MRAGWPQLTADPSTGGSLSLNEGTTSGHSGWYKLGSPTVADLFKNGKKEIVIGSEDGRLYVYNPDGSLAPGWPKRLDAPSMPTSPINGAPAVGDIDGDGHPDIVSGDENGWVFAFNVDGTLKAGWPQFTGWNGDYPNNCSTAVCTGVVSSPIYATGVGLVQYGARNLFANHFRVRGSENVYSKVKKRMRSWLGEIF